ncbi:hypothetical protein ASG01_08360 [Chryseobacterium sp. Leaf180]|uniref:glycosyltransferase family 4 protein n=1 Tax=Chryseobacterium sp. Leaf180 TaxID=1736289 RepID=UPI0006F30F5E|nr:glycosyltransferase family 4 protein [Chryseobacterium sp. Leaf180]KQR93861.1 hypothetical protein ASG01_08360 [Chryseobacterium sp. Leaf180]
MVQNILIVTKEYHCSLNENVGGTGIFYKNLCEELAKRGFKPYVFLISRKNFELTENGVSIYSVKDIFKSKFLMETMRSLTGKISLIKDFSFKIYLLEKKIIQKKIRRWMTENALHFDVAETHDWDGLALAIPQNIKSVIRCHGSWTVLKKYFGYGKVKEGRIFCEKIAIENCKNIITISKFNEKINRELFDLGKTKLIYNGIDETVFNPDLKTEKISKSVFYLGNVSREKGADTLLENFIKIKDKFNDATLHFIGNSNDFPAKVSEINTNPKFRSSVIFHGKKSRSEIASLLSQAEVICFPSKGENFSLSLLESMAMRKPIVCSDIPSFTEIIKDYENGLIAFGNDFAEKVSVIFNDIELAEKISNSARKTVEDHFTLHRMIDETVNFYNTIK